MKTLQYKKVVTEQKKIEAKKIANIKKVVLGESTLSQKANIVDINSLINSPTKQ